MSEATRFSDYVKNVAGVQVVGVVRDWELEPPGSLATADLPAKFIRVPTSTRDRYVFCVGGGDYQGSGEMTVEVVIITNAVAQGLPLSNTTLTAEMADHLLHAYTQADIAMSWPSVNVRQTIFSIAGIDYWALVAQVTARG